MNIIPLVVAETLVAVAVILSMLSFFFRSLSIPRNVLRFLREGVK